MDTRELVRKAWSDAGLYAQPQPQLREFLEYFDNHPTGCWETVAAEFREKYYGLYNLVLPPLADSSDTMLRLQLIRHIDPARPQELKTLKHMASTAGPAQHLPELKALHALNHPEIKKQLGRRKTLKSVLAPPTEPVRRPVTNVLRPPASPAKRKRP